MSTSERTRDGALATRVLGALTQGLLRVPRWSLAAGVLLAVLCAALAGVRLGYHTNRLDLLNPHSAYNQRWLAYLEEFGREDDAIVVFQSGDRQALLAAIDQTAAALAAHPESFHGILSRIDVAPLRRKALHYLSAQELQRLIQAMEQAGPAITGDWARLALASQLHDWTQQASQLAAAPDSPEVAAAYERLSLHVQCLLVALQAALDGLDATAVPLVPPLIDVSAHPLSQLAGDHDGHLLLDNGRTGLLLVRLQKSDEQQLVQGTAAIRALREVLAEQRPRHPDVHIGLTGLPVLEHDEMETSQYDMCAASLISLAGVAVLFVAGFGGVRLPLLTVATLILAMFWSLGYTVLSVGHLNILSISFGVILIGLGIDYGIHYVSRYAELRDADVPCEAALVGAMRDVGPGILTGGITTAAAFFSAVLTEFTGVAELGIIAGGGILLCIAATLALLPVLIRLSERNDRVWRPARPLPLAILCRPASWTPRFWIAVTVAGTLGLGLGLPRLAYDHNLLNLQAKGLDSVTWEHRLLESGEHSVWFAVSMAQSREELQQRKRRFEQLPTVQRTEEIMSLLPAADAARTRLITQLQDQVRRLPQTVPALPIASREELLVTLQHVQAVLAAGERWPVACLQLAGQLPGRLLQADWAQLGPQIGRFQQQLAAATLKQLHALQEVAEPAAPTLDDLPPALRDRFVGKTGRCLLRIYARGSVWDMDALTQFVRDVESVDPQVTGHPVQTYYSSRQMQASYLHAAIYSLLAVAIVLMLDFGSVRVSLLAMMPMLCGVVQLFGLLGWLAIPLNPANLIVLPLILGIGIDDGVHVMHDYLRTSGRYRVSHSTATAIILTTATTMVGFGSMMIAHHQGLRSLGQVLALGVGCCLLTGLITLPAVLAVLSPRGVSATTAPARHERLAPHFLHRHRTPVVPKSPALAVFESPRRANPDRGS